ncbi:hypothetical protein U27_03990 [Candidatus Vecturithrix granuli]|uniref:ParB-like N-terminal domain-containing protein n=1 Tax=Vecturithrix granuli TaxID=1499967 RepID=A0A081BXH1_VECG1|nr:hypothetical protein U27_03990 [Candidatus Vecturithrix granuli]
MFHTIECTQLDFNDTTFLMSYPLEAPAVMASVATIGVVQPILVTGCPCQGKYRILAGFRRAYAGRAIGLETIHANIYPVEPDHLLSAFLLALYENLAHRAFNDVEKSLILTKLLYRFGCSRDDVIRDFLPLLGLAPHEKVLDTYLSIFTFEEALKAYLATHEVPMTVIELLSTLSAENRNVVFALLSTLKLGINKLKDFLVLLEEIAFRDQQTIADILAEPGIQAIFRHDKYSGPQKADLIRQALRRRRYPQLTTLEAEYHEQLSRLHLPKAVQLATDRFFEDDALTASFRFQTPEQLHTLAKELLRLSEQPELQDLFTLIQG